MIRRAINAIQILWLRFEAHDLRIALDEIKAMYGLNGVPAGHGVAQAYKARLDEIDVRIATLQPPLKRRPLPLTTT